MAIDFARGAATQVGTTILRKVAGGIGQIIKSRQPSPTSPVESTTRTKYATKSLSFPLDIGEDPGVGNHGHYMMFFINEVKPAKLKYGEPQDGQKNNQQAKAQMNVHEEVRESDTKQISLTESVNVRQSGAVIKNTKKRDDITQQKTQDEIVADNARQQTNQKGKNTLSIQRAPTTRLDTAIQLYMPPQVQVSYVANYTDTEVGILTQTGVNVFDAIMRGDQQTIGDNFKKGAVDLGVSSLLKMADVAAPGARAAYEIGQGQIIADRLELAFKGIAKRKFQYVFKMMPRNEREAQEIKQICQAFKVNMLPEFAGGDRQGRRMVVPNTFNIHYMYLGSQNQYLDPISECVLTNMSVSYGGERFRTFDPDSSGNPPPVETQIQLDFSELELITREKVLEENEPMSFGPTNSTN